MSYKIVFFDIDGTLLNEEKQIPEDAREAIHRLQANGTQVAIATGRATFHLRDVADQLGIDSYVCFNGSCAVHQGKIVHEEILSETLIENLEQQASRYGHPLVFLNHEEYWVNHERHPLVQEAFQTLRLQPPGYRSDYWRGKPVHQLLLHCPIEEERFYQDGEDSGFSFVRWHPVSVDVIPSGSSKAKGIASMLRYLSIHPEEAVAFGDGLNDREMLSFVGMGIAMGNAHEELKAKADWVTSHVAEGGIKKGLSYLKLI